MRKGYLVFGLWAIVAFATFGMVPELEPDRSRIRLPADFPLVNDAVADARAGGNIALGRSQVAGFPQDGSLEAEKPDSAQTGTDGPGTGESDAVEPRTTTREIVVDRGDTLMELLVRNGLVRSEAHSVVTSLRPVYDLQRMQIGQRFSITLDTGDSDDDDVAPSLVRLSFRPNVEKDIVLHRDSPGHFAVEVIARKLELTDGYSEGLITTSLYDAAVAAKMPNDVMAELIRIFSFDVDFQREIQPNDEFSVLFEQFRDTFGMPVRNGQILWASMTLSGKEIAYSWFVPKDGYPDYYDFLGKSSRKALLRTPVNGARLSSGFGKRRHPILGYTKLHKGVDFAAKTGVPIFAAGDGVIEKIGRNGSFGKYIRIRHNSTYKTAYAHLSKFLRGIKKGSKVRQGSVIGYVGSTGRTTGPHLHYEVFVNGRQVNPMGLRLAAGDQLIKTNLKNLRAGWPLIAERVEIARGDRKLAKK